MAESAPASHAFPPYDPRRAAGRFTISAVVGAVTALALPASLGTPLRLVSAWDAAVTVLLTFAWFIIIRADSNETCRRAAAEDPGRSAVWALVGPAPPTLHR